MPSPDVPQMIFHDGADTPGMSTNTNDSMPRMGGFAEPGSEMYVKWDDMAAQRVEVDQDGMWDYSVPELQNGDHDFEMWTRDPQTGEVSDSVEFEHNVDADDSAREWQRSRNRDWDAGGRDDWREDNRRMRDSLGRGGGGGGGGGKPPEPHDPGRKPDDPAGSGREEGATRTGGSQPPTGGGGPEPAGGRGGGEQWLEKGNTPS